jgi:hypothetical protein
MPLRLGIPRTLSMLAVGAMLSGMQSTAYAATDGISALVQVANKKAGEATSEALGAAERQRQLIAERRAKGQDVKLDEQQLQALNANAAKVKDLEKRLKDIQEQLKKGCS